VVGKIAAKWAILAATRIIAAAWLIIKLFAPENRNPEPQ
jgi:hypothetical protein